METNQKITSSDKMILMHQQRAMQSFQMFKQKLMQKLQSDLKIIQVQLQKELSKVCRKLQAKIKGGYMSSLSAQMQPFFLDPYISKEQQKLTDSVNNLKGKILDYINQFCSTVLQKNIQKTGQISLFHYQNKIKHVFPQWYSVTSRNPLNRAQITVKGFDRPTTSWLALGVSKSKKQYGPVKKSMKFEEFIGNIYLNGSDYFAGDYKTKKDLSDGDVFVIQNNNRMIYVYRKTQAKNKNQVFILDDNVEYYFYIAMKGPLTLTFIGQ